MKLNKLNILFAVAIILLGGSALRAQDLRSSQPFTQPLSFNPSLMSANDGFRVNVGYRSQWMNINDGYTSFHGTALIPALVRPNMKIDAGVSYFNDRAGAFQINDVDLALSARLEISTDHFLSLSLMGGYLGSQLATDELIFDDQYQAGSYSSSNPTTEALTDGQNSIADVGFGVLWYYAPEEDKVAAYAGVSGYHFYAPQEVYTENSDAVLPGKYNYMTGLKFMPNDRVHVSPNLRATMQGGANEFALGLYVDYIATKNKAVKVKRARGLTREAKQDVYDAEAELKRAKRKLREAKRATTMDSTSIEEGEEIEPKEEKEPKEIKAKQVKPVTTTRDIEPQFSVGVWYNAVSQMPTFIIGVKYDRYAIGYSYDFAPAMLRETAFDTSTHEITLGFFLNSDLNSGRTPFHLW